MAIRTLGFPRALAARRYTVPSFSSISSPRSHLHTLDPPSDTPLPPERKASVSEHFVLEELTELLEIETKNLVSHSNPPPVVKTVEKSESVDVRAVDGILSPAEKLRGIFLQKLKGKFAVESALSATGVNLTPEVFAEVVNWGSLGGAAMVSFFDWAIKQPNLPHCTETYNVIVKALGRRRFFGFIEEILFRMKREGISPDPRTVALMLDTYVAGRRVHSAVEMFGRLEEIGWRCDSESLAALLHSLCRLSHVKVANAVLNKVRRKIPFTTMVYNEIIGGWAKLGRVDEVERNWAAMVADGLNPDTHTFSHLIRSLGKAGRINDAVDAFEKMEEKGCVPDVVTFNAMISNFIFARDLDKGMQYYMQMAAKNCLPDTIITAKLICALLKLRRVADALELFDEMLNRGICPTTGMITSFIEPLCSYGPPHAAMMIYNKAKNVGCRMSMKAYKLLLMRLSKFGKCGMLLKIWEEMQENGHPSDVEVYEYIIDGLCNAGKLDHAVLVMEESMKHRLCIRRVVYSKLSNKLLEMNKVETAYKLLLKVREARCRANMQRIWYYNGWHFS